jgi:FkbM family methyltransferase
MVRFLPKPVKLLLRLPGLLRRSLRVSRKLGFSAARDALRAYLAFWSADPDRMAGSRRILGLRARGYSQPFGIRTHTSDVFVFEQVFVDEGYSPLTGLHEPRLIVDCGANIGCTSVYLLTRYPHARLIAVEPDAENARMCAANLAQFGERAEVLQAGIWHCDALLRVERGGFRDGREWSFQVRECRPGESGEVRAVSLPTLLEKSGFGRIDILKIDVEGAERYLFADGCHDWLSRVDCLAVEAHDDECRDAVLRAVAEQRFEVTRRQETIFCFRRPHASDESKAEQAIKCEG